MKPTTEGDRDSCCCYCSRSESSVSRHLVYTMEKKSFQGKQKELAEPMQW